MTDLIVVGGGAAGLSAVREARRRNASVTIISDGPFGGDCTFTGCVPSKTVIESSRRGASFSEAFTRAQEVIARIAATENPATLRSEGAKVIESRADLVGPRTVRVDGKELTAKGVILAFGAKPSIPPIEGLDSIHALTNESLWGLKSSPDSMVIVGGGPIGCELGQALAGLGVRVTIVEFASRVLSRDEPEASEIVADCLIRAGVDLRLGVAVDRVSPAPGGGVVCYLGGETIIADQLLLATGRTPNTSPEMVEAGLELDRHGFIVTSDDMATSVEGVYAAGDVVGRLQFTHAADYMGRVAAGNILRRFGSDSYNEAWVPRVTFTDPEVASIGMTESEAASETKGALVAELPLAEHDRALAAGATEGYIKLIAGPKPLIGHRVGGGEIIGATIVAERAGEMISEISLLMRLGAFTGRLAQAVHPYPTWSYGLPKAAAQFFTTIEDRTARPARSQS